MIPHESHGLEYFHQPLGTSPPSQGTSQVCDVTINLGKSTGTHHCHEKNSRTTATQIDQIKKTCHTMRKGHEKGEMWTWMLNNKEG